MASTLSITSIGSLYEDAYEAQKKAQKSVERAEDKARRAGRALRDIENLAKEQNIPLPDLELED